MNEERSVSELDASRGEFDQYKRPRIEEIQTLN